MQLLTYSPLVAFFLFNKLLFTVDKFLIAVFSTVDYADVVFEADRHFIYGGLHVFRECSPRFVDYEFIVSV